MKKLLILVVFLLPLLGAGCEQPCSRVAEQVCLAHGASSSQCSETKEFSERAGITERGQCRTALQVIDALGGGGKPAPTGR